MLRKTNFLFAILSLAVFAGEQTTSLGDERYLYIDNFVESYNEAIETARLYSGNPNRVLRLPQFMGLSDAQKADFYEKFRQESVPNVILIRNFSTIYVKDRDSGEYLTRFEARNF